MNESNATPRADLIDEARDAMEKLTPAERIAVITDYCPSCGKFDTDFDCSCDAPDLPRNDPDPPS